VEARNRSSQSAELPNERHQGNLRLTPEGGRHMVLRKDKVEIGNSRLYGVCAQGVRRSVTA
jgi:hypothetical protein